MKTLAKAYNKKSLSSFKAATLLLKHDFLEEATTLAYYAMYHKATALFKKANITCHSHEHAIQTLGLFGISSEPLRKAKHERIQKQYYADHLVARNDVEKLLEQAQEFIALIDVKQDSLTPHALQEIHERFKL